MSRSIENHVKVYLDRDPGEPWRVDPVTVDGATLDGLDNGDFLNVGTGVSDEEARADLNSVNLPDGHALTALLIDAVEGDAVKRLLTDYDTWAAERTRVSGAEDRGEADSDDWARMDDAGTALAHRFAALLKNLTAPKPQG